MTHIHYDLYLNKFMYTICQQTEHLEPYRSFKINKRSKYKTQTIKNEKFTFNILNQYIRENCEYPYFNPKTNTNCS